MKLPRRQLLLGLAGVGLMAQAAAEEPAVDLALVVAIDCSFSVDANEFRQQMGGLGRAFQRKEVSQAIRAGPLGRIAVSAVQWSDDRNQLVIVPWTVVAAGDSVRALGLLIESIPRRLAEGGTSISTALLYCEALFGTAPSAARRVIDISSDGRNNIGPPVAPARDRLVANGITINALTILNEWPTLHIYFQDHVVGGEGHFVLTAENYADYEEAMLLKLVREITGPGIS